MEKICILLFIGLLILPVSLAENESNAVNSSQHNTTILEHENNCNNFSIEGLKEIYTNEEKISYSFQDFEEGDEITYWIEDLFGNIWKNKYTSSNNNKKTYTPKIEESDRVLVVKAERKRTECDLVLVENKIIIIKEENQVENTTQIEINETTNNTNNETATNSSQNEEETTSLEEDIQITFYDDEVQSGEAMHVEITVQKNSNRNNVFYLWLGDEEGEEKNQEIKINLHQKGSYDIEIEFPVQLDACGNAFEKKYLYFNGLGKEEKEKVYVLQASCPEIDEEVCAELTIQNDIILEENPISSLYVRAQKWQENISMYSNSEKEMDVWIIGPNAEHRKLNTGTNAISISPQVGNNSYAVIDTNGIGRIVHFYLEGNKEEKNNEKKEENRTIEQIPPYQFTYEKKEEGKEKEETLENKITSEVIYTTEKKRNLPLIGSILLISIIGILFTQHKEKKRKVLRSKNDSEKTPW